MRPSRRSIPTIWTKSAPRSSWPTPTTCTCGRATSGSSVSADSIGSWAGTGPILTDSGGFQVVSLGDLRVVDDDGVTFRSHIDGSLHRFTPEHAIDVQQALGSDVAVAFDQPVRPGSSSRADVAEATQRTHHWAERSLAAHTRAGSGDLRDRPGRDRTRPPGGQRPVHRLAPIRRDLPRRTGWGRDRGGTQCRPRRGDPGPRSGSAGAVPDGPRLAARHARGRASRSRPVRLGPARAGRPDRPGMGPGRSSEPAQPALPRRPGTDPGRLSVPRLPSASRGPMWPICSAPRSSSDTGSRLVTT